MVHLFLMVNKTIDKSGFLCLKFYAVDKCSQKSRRSFHRKDNSSGHNRVLMFVATHFRVFRLRETSFTWTQDYCKIIQKLQTMYLKPGSVFQYIKDERSLCILSFYYVNCQPYTLMQK